MRAALLIAAAVGALSGLGKDLDRTHPAVVGVGGATGTLIADRVVLTAGHVTPAPGADDSPRAIAIGDNTLKADRRIGFSAATDSHPHPLFLSAVEQFGRTPTERADFIDVGVLVLPEASGVKPAALPAAGVLDHPQGGDRFVGVGYGYHEVVHANAVGVSATPDGNRRQWRTGIRVLNAGWIQLDDDPKKGYGSICRGDSGAPIFLERGGREILVAVVSHSDGQDCGPGVPTYASRVDNPVVLNWITDVYSTQRPQSSQRDH